MALPMLDAMLTGATWAAAGSAKPPKRMGFFFVPNGAHMPDWTPTAEGSNFELPRILKPLAPFQKELLVFSGLGQDNANSKGDAGRR